MYPRAELASPFSLLAASARRLHYLPLFAHRNCDGRLFSSPLSFMSCFAAATQKTLPPFIILISSKAQNSSRRAVTNLLAQTPSHKRNKTKQKYKQKPSAKPWTGDHSARPSMKSAASREN